VHPEKKKEKYNVLRPGRYDDATYNNFVNISLTTKPHSVQCKGDDKYNYVRLVPRSSTRIIIIINVRLPRPVEFALRAKLPFTAVAYFDISRAAFCPLTIVSYITLKYSSVLRSFS